MTDRVQTFHLGLMFLGNYFFLFPTNKTVAIKRKEKMYFFFNKNCQQFA